MKLARISDKGLVVNILVKSFIVNPSVNYVVKQDRKKEARIRRLMEYSFNVCNAFGEVWLSDDLESCALLLFPTNKRVTPRTIFWDIKLAFSVIGIGRVLQVLSREALIKKSHSSGPMCYLWFIGVNPDKQGKGAGSGLLKEILNHCDKKELPIYLETSVERNALWYKKYKFEIYKTINLSYPLYLLKRLVNR